jgi:hypothetical protein
MYWLEQHHDLKIGGHTGCWKTLKLISRSYWWPNMSQYIGQYCKLCDLCLRTKAQKCKPFSELHSLTIPKAQWDVISVDFIIKLPNSHRFDAIMVVTDLVSKQSHFILTCKGNLTIRTRGSDTCKGKPKN